MEYEIETTLFGKINIPADEGLFEDFSIELGGKEMSVNLYVVEDFLNESNLERVKSVMEQIPKMYETARKYISDNMNSNGFIKYFIECHIEELEGLEELFDVSSARDITPEMFINRLEPRAIRISNDKETFLDCIFDFSLPEDYSDELLVVSFNEQCEIIDITHES